MSKKKNEPTRTKKFPNQLRIQPWLIDRMFIGRNGRFGTTEKAWKDFSFDELCEFAIAHNKETVDKHFIGIIPPNYVSPFDAIIELPIKPETDKDEQGE